MSIESRETTVIRAARASAESVLLGPRHKSFPPHSWGSTAEQFLEDEPVIGDFQTPLLTIDSAAVRHNVDLMAGWLTANGLQIAPHGKTTMAPLLWRQLLDAGAWGLTLATAWQVQFARSVGIDRVLLANELVDPVAIGWIAAELDGHPDFEFACWSDSLQSVRVMETVLEDVGAGRPIDVLVELGAVGGRTGARDLATARAVAREIVASPHLRLVGIGGYEGALAHDRSPESLSAMRAYLDALVSLHEELAAAGSYGDVVPIITAGGSAYFDLVALAFSAVSGPTVKLLRSGAYQAHDDGFYRGISPFVQRETDRPFRAAVHAWVRVLSRPEPGLAIFDGGRRDLPYDDGLPRAQLIAGATDAESRRLLDGSTVIALNDQHGFLRLADAVADPAVLPVGSVLRLGLSHPCSAFDKWRLIPMTDDSDGLASRVVDFAETWF